MWLERLDCTGDIHDTDANLEPSHIEEELKNCEEWNDEIDAVSLVLPGVQKLTTK